MEQKSGVQISQRAFIQSLAILFALMMCAGVLTRLVPAGLYSRAIVDGREVIDPNSFTYVESPDYPVWRWFTAPLEVLFAEGSLTVIVIIIFLLFIGGSFAILDKSGIIHAAIDRIVQRFGGQKYVLLLVISLFFMLMGAFFGLFEEVVPLVPVTIVLAYSLGWDALVGLGMSILATNMGFSAAITNPFTIGVAQKLAGLPLFSGAWFRVIVFGVIYTIFALFLVAYARRVERTPQASLLFGQDQGMRDKYQGLQPGEEKTTPGMNRALAWFAACLGLILVVLFVGPFIPAIAEFSLPLVGVMFLVAGVGAGLLAGSSGREVGKALGEGIIGMAPSIPLILMAVSIKYIIVQGMIMDTILHSAAQYFASASPFVAALTIYLLALLIEFFVASGSAKAFLMMPILLPLADLIGVTRQTTVTAYCFGDGFSNLVYPTNPVLLICLGLAVVGYPTWLRWTARLWFWVVLATVGFLWLAVAINLGPF